MDNAQNDTPDGAACNLDAPPGRKAGRLQRFIGDLGRDVPDVLRPRSWFGFRGRMSRKAFWMFYLFNIFVISAAASLSEVVASLAPGAADLLLPFILFVVMMGSMLALCGAMMRRLHDAGMSVWIPPLTLFVLLGAICTWLIEGAVYQLNADQGTLDAWIAARWPLTESAGLAALVLSAVLFVGLMRKSRPVAD